MTSGSTASVALLMLDIASAKSSLAQLQQTFQTATTEHQRTLEELDVLKKEYDVSPLYAKTATAGDKATAHQLQALHTENLQLKALLKQEIEARQQLEHQHAATLDLLRCCGMQDMLGTLHGVQMAPSSGGGLSANELKLYNRGQPAHLSMAAAAATAATLDTNPCSASLRTLPEESSQTSVQPLQHIGGVGLASAGPWSTTTTCTAGTQQMEFGPPPIGQLSNGSGGRWAAASGHHSSAYFPYQEHQCGASSDPSPDHHTSAADSTQAAGTGFRQGAEWLQQYNTSSEYRRPNHNQYSSQQSAGNHHSSFNMQQRQRTADPASRAAGASRASDAAIAGTAAAGFGISEHDIDAELDEVSASESLSTSCSQSAATEMLDSDDLEELAGLCDGLISQASRQQLAFAAMQHAAGASASAAEQESGNGTHAAGAASSHAAVLQQQPRPAGPFWQQGDPHDLKVAGGHGVQEQHTQQQLRGNCPLQEVSSSSGKSEQHAPVLRVPDIEVLAAELYRLQQQVAAAGIEPGPAANILRAALDATSSSLPAANPGAANTDFGSLSAPARSSSSAGDDGSAAACSAATAAAAAPASANSSIAGLQQQLAARMAEVKQRLSNICTGMLEEATAAGDACVAASCKASSAAVAAAAQPPVQGYDLHHHLRQQHQQEQVPDPQQQWFNSNESKPSSRDLNWDATGSWGSGGLKHLHAADSSRDGSYPRKVPPSVAFEVHADGHVDAYVSPTPPSAQARSGSGGFRPAGRVRVGGPSLWASSKSCTGAAAAGGHAAGPCRAVSQGASQGDAAAATATSLDTDVGAVEAEAAGGSSESSWATAEEDEQEQVQSRQQHHQQHLGCGEKNLESGDYQTPPRVQQQQQQMKYHVPRQQYTDTENDHENEQARQRQHQHAPGEQQYRTPTKQQQDAARSGANSQQGASWQTAAGSGGMQGSSIAGQWQHRQQRSVSEDLEGVLFGLKGRVAAEVSQTFSPLKGGGSGCKHMMPSSPVTPLRPRNA